MPERTCDHCSQPFTPSKYASSQRFCDTECKRAWQRAHRDSAASHRHRTARRAAARAERELQRRLAVAAALAAWSPAPTPALLPRGGCPYCGEPVEPGQGYGCWCSTRCYRRHKAGKPRVLPCARCGSGVDALLGGRSRVYCDRCTREIRRDRKRNERHVRRARTATGERISLRAIAVRDEWTCHLCRGPVTESTWSLDHIVPLALGGTHTHDNVALACHRCNTLKATEPVGAITYSIATTRPTSR